MITTGRVYKVWIEIEEYDIEKEEGETVPCLNIPCSGTFATEQQAEEFAKKLHAYAEELPDEQVDHA